MTTTKKRPSPWSDSENAALVSLYFTMLDKAIAGQHYNKAAMIRQAQSDGVSYPLDLGALKDRSRGSVELKLMNASATHRDLGGAVTMDGYGYRCLPNYQATLKVAMLTELQRRDNALVAEQTA